MAGSGPKVEKSPDRLSGLSGKYLHNQWETRSGDFDIGKSAWNHFVQRIATKAARDLGVEVDGGAVKVKMDRLRFWKVGACLPPLKECVSWLDPC